MSQTSDNSRTFRIINLSDEVKTSLSGLNATVTQHENINYVEVSTVSDIAPVKKVLDDAEMKYKQCSYSTFVRFKDNMSVDDLNKFATSVCPDINVLYSRVDENNHTGKLVVDRLEDYNMLKSNTGDVSFYRFSPLNVPRTQTRGGEQHESNDNGGAWEKARPSHRQSVQGRYTQPAAAPVSAPTRGVGAARGRGRGRPAKSAPSSA
jgi:hypothetical protein